MSETYDASADAEADRAQQRALLKALGAPDRALRRDESGAWRINGARGSVHSSGRWQELGPIRDLSVRTPLERNQERPFVLSRYAGRR